MILLVFVLLLADLVSVAFPLFAFFLWREWDRYNGGLNDGYADRCLYAAIALVLLTLLGRFLIRALLSKRRAGEDEPHFFDAPKRELLDRPDGTRINIEYYGNEAGQPIVFIHGLNATIKNWYYQRKYFEKDYRLIMIDLPGLGKSTRPTNKDFSLPKIASDLQAVIAHTGAKNPLLWGHSMGGMTILTLLAGNKLAPIKGVILEHTTYTNPVHTMIFHRVMRALQKPVFVPVCYLLIALSPIVWLMRWMSYLNGNSLILTRWLTFAGTQTPTQLDFTTLLSTLAPPAVTARSLLAMFRYDVSDKLSSMNVPALIIGAGSDRLTKPTASEYMADHMPHAELVIVSPANHQGLLERHVEVNAAASRFIQGLG
jgi:pimeloyl-ACP methyl ester carboxylesterase